MSKSRKFFSVASAFLLITMLASCYKFGRIVAPKQVNPHEAFNGRIVVVNDNNNGPVTTYGIFAVRVPENWEVEVGENAYVQYAEEGVVIPADGEHPDEKPAGPGSLTGTMHYSSLLSSFYNQSNPKEGYTWVAFVTDEKHRVGVQGSSSSSCDSIAFNYTVINDGVEGDYELDYIIGDEESDFERFKGDVKNALDTRVYCTSSESSILPKNDKNEEAFDHVQTEFKTIVTVLPGGTDYTLHRPAVVVDTENPQAGQALTISFADMPAGASIGIYREGDIVPQKQGYVVEGEKRFNEGSFTVEGLVSGTYNVRAVDVVGSPIRNMQGGSFAIAYPEFEKGNYNFVVMSDLNLMAPELVKVENPGEDDANYAEYAAYLQTPEVVKEALDQVVEQKPSALFITGDLTKDGEKLSHNLLASLLKPVADAGIKVYVIPGDKDINNPNAKSYESDAVYADNISAAEFAEIYGAFGYNDAVARDENSLSYVVYPNDKLAVICIDDNRYSENLRAGDAPSDEDVLVEAGRITKETLAWIEQVVRQTEGRKIVVMMHHLASAPFNGYDTLGSVVNGASLDLSAYFGGGDEEQAEEYEVSNADVQQFFQNVGVWAAFCGDVQASDIQFVGAGDGSDNGFYQVATASLRAFNSNYRQVTVNDEDLTVITRPIRNTTDEADFITLESYLSTVAPVTVSRACAENWDMINGIFQENFTFDYNPETDIINKNEFMRLPESAEDLANRVNTTILPPMLNVITAFVEGNEQLKDSQKLVDDLKAGFDRFFDTLNSWPDLITPMIKEGFAEAGLDTDALVERVAGSLAFNYLGTEDNVTDDLFVTLAYRAVPLSVGRLVDNTATESAIYDLQGRRLQGEPVKGVYIKDGKKVVK
ncbi:MAG: metallophosphoesterase [Prevotella sp.]|nr:metallophosphoesterase [Prevotella sp.]